MPHRRVPDRDNALAAALLHRFTLYGRLDDADLPVRTARAEQRPLCGVPRWVDAGPAILSAL